MKPDLRLAPTVLALWLGAAIGLHTALRASLAVLMVTIAIAAFALLRQGRRLSTWWLVSLAIGALLAALRVDAAAPRIFAAEVANSGAVPFEAILDTEPALIERTAHGGLQMQQVMRAHAILVRARTAQGTWSTSIPVTLQWQPRGQAPAVGAHVRGVALLHPDDAARRSTFRVALRGPLTIVSGPSRGTTLATAVRHGLAKASNANSGNAGAALLPGLVLGDTRAQSTQLVDSLRVSGLSHLTAVSGANLAIVTAAVIWLLRRTRIRARWRHAIAALTIVGFVVVVQPQPSVVRAAAMGGISLFAAATGRRSTSASVLWLTVVALLVIDPFLAWQYGFALSVAATAGLIVVRPYLAPHLPRGALGVALTITLSAQLATLPILLAMGRPPTWLSIPANLVCEPLVAPATIAGFVAAMLAAFALLPIPVLSPLFMTLATLAALPGVWIASIIAWVATVGAGSPLAFAPIRSVLGLVVASALVALALRAGVRPRSLIALACAYLLVTACVPRVVHRWPPHDWWYAMCDIGQGDATVFNLGSGSALVVDAGPDPQLVHECLRMLGVHRVIALFITHFHADHVEGVPGVVAQAPVDRVFTTPLHEPAIEWQRTRAALHTAFTEVHVGDGFLFGDTEVRVLWPDPARLDGTPNNASLVLDVQRRGVHALVTGDADPAAQAALVLPIRGYAVFKVPHHGSRYQDPDFVSRVRPSLALVSVGEGNDYGHPAVATIDALRAQGVRVVRTDESGAIAISVRGGAIAYTVLSG